MTEPWQKVFGIAELLEQVLLALPMKDILFLQRVGKFWKATIRGSLKLQRALFLKADGIADHRYEGTITLNPLLKRLLPPVFADSDQIDRRGHITLHASLEHDEASWHSMLVTKPAVVNVHTFVLFYHDGSVVPATSRAEVITRADGVTARDVLDWIKKAHSRHRRYLRRYSFTAPAVTACYFTVLSNHWKVADSTD